MGLRRRRWRPLFLKVSEPEPTRGDFPIVGERFITEWKSLDGDPERHEAASRAQSESYADLIEEAFGERPVIKRWDRELREFVVDEPEPIKVASLEEFDQIFGAERREEHERWALYGPTSREALEDWDRPWVVGQQKAAEAFAEMYVAMADANPTVADGFPFFTASRRRPPWWARAVAWAIAAWYAVARR